jgi:hypothetical protein
MADATKWPKGKRCAVSLSTAGPKGAIQKRRKHDYRSLE